MGSSTRWCVPVDLCIVPEDEMRPGNASNAVIVGLVSPAYHSAWLERKNIVLVCLDYLDDKRSSPPHTTLWAENRQVSILCLVEFTVLEY